MVIGAIV